MENVAIFWDYENCPVPSNTSGYAIVGHLRTVAEPYGSVRSLKAYLEVTEQTPFKTLLMRSELQSSGVSLVDCPHNGRKDVADKMIIVDMLAHALDNPAPSTIILITGDRDFAYAMSILRLRRYRLVLVTLPNAHVSLTAQATVCLRWNDIMMSVPNDTPSNVFGQVPSPPSQVYPAETVTNSPCDIYNRLRTDHYKQFDAVQTPRSEIHNPLPADLYAPELTNSSEQQWPTVRDFFGHRQYPFNMSSTLSQSSNPTVSYGCQSESIVPITDSLYTKPSNKPFVALAEIKASNSFPGPSRTLSSSDPHGNVALTRTDEPVKPLYNEPPLVSLPPRATFQPSPPPTTEISECALPVPVVPVHFKVLVQCLQNYRLKGNFRPLRSIIAPEVAKSGVFKKAGVDRFKQYTMIAVELGIVELGGTEGDAWIFLKPQWIDAK
ncbi:hypothetical protein CVT25_006491 [Psilocybe cyanescens]|uniref:NYN domain-containing protein n=1 Tax=Psilocybe cyanescens TaxID=93625 RepID=A0A409XE97_PSICY|nr:hypothetical protein CVT25_006491 [Psilocybe cyanescens]